MPVFDPIQRSLAVRIVYDGPAFAGKTTNIERICEMVPVERRTELFTPGALKGRTMFFDWLEVAGPKLGDIDIRVQLLSVPGQVQRSYRRRPLLLSADAVVFVADSSGGGFAESKRSFRLLSRYLRERDEPVPLLLQANKQDLDGALRPEDVASELRGEDTLPVVGATACDGGGVRETLQAAMKLAIKDVRERVKRLGMASIAGTVETADALFDSLLEAEERYLMGELEVPDPLVDEIVAPAPAQRDAATPDGPVGEQDGPTVAPDANGATPDGPVGGEQNGSGVAPDAATPDGPAGGEQNGSGVAPDAATPDGPAGEQDDPAAARDDSEAARAEQGEGEPVASG